MPSSLILSQISCSKSSIWSMGSRSASLARAGAVSKVPPIPTPTTIGGQGREPAFLATSATNSGILSTSEGSIIFICDIFSEPAPFGRTVMENFSPGLMWIAGIPSPQLSPEFLRLSGFTAFGRRGTETVARRTPSSAASKSSAE